MCNNNKAIIQNEADKVAATLPNMRQIERLFIRVNHNNREPSYLQQLAHLTESCKEWLTGSTGKSIRADMKNRTCQARTDCFGACMAFTLNVLIQVWLSTNPDHTQAAFLFVEKVKHEEIPVSSPYRMSYFCLVVAAHVTPLFLLMYLCSQGLLHWQKVSIEQWPLTPIFTCWVRFNKRSKGDSIDFAHQSQFTCQLEYSACFKMTSWALELC